MIRKIHFKRGAGTVWIPIAVLAVSGFMWNFSFNHGNDALFDELDFIAPICLWFIFVPVLLYQSEIPSRSFPGTTWIKSCWWWAQYVVVFAGITSSYLMLQSLGTFSAKSFKISAVVLVIWIVVLLVVELKNLALRPGTVSGKGKTPHKGAAIDVDDKSQLKFPYYQEWPY